MVIEKFKLTDEHIEKLNELGYIKTLDTLNGFVRYSKEIGNRSRINVAYSTILSCLFIDTSHTDSVVIINHFGYIHKIYDDYIHVWQTLKEDMEKVFGLDVITERITKEK